MSGPSQENILLEKFAAFAEEQAGFDLITRNMPLGLHEIAQLGRDISRSSHAAAREIIRVIGDDPTSWGPAIKLLQNHQWHSEYLLQSDFIRQALNKPYGYAGDMDLMVMIYKNEDRGRSTYARLKNNVYQSLPAAEAVRQRVKGMERILRAMPEGSHVMSLACGPAWEIDQIAQDAALTFTVDLLDHDPRTISYTRDILRNSGVRHVNCNAFDLIKGKTTFPQVESDGNTSFELGSTDYDMIYSTGLYDYVSTYPMNHSRGATGLTRKLFERLKPGGKLIVGNFLKPGAENPHQVHHQFMMEAYSDWKLIYRSSDDIWNFASAIPPDLFKADLYDETLLHPVSPTSVLGFLVLEKLP